MSPGQSIATGASEQPMCIINRKVPIKSSGINGSCSQAKLEQMDPNTIKQTIISQTWGWTQQLLFSHIDVDHPKARVIKCLVRSQSRQSTRSLIILKDKFEGQTNDPSTVSLILQIIYRPGEHKDDWELGDSLVWRTLWPVISQDAFELGKTLNQRPAGVVWIGHCFGFGSGLVLDIQQQQHRHKERYQPIYALCIVIINHLAVMNGVDVSSSNQGVIIIPQFSAPWWSGKEQTQAFSRQSDNCKIQTQHQPAMTLQNRKQKQMTQKCSKDFKICRRRNVDEDSSRRNFLIHLKSMLDNFFMNKPMRVSSAYKATVMGNSGKTFKSVYLNLRVLNNLFQCPELKPHLNEFFRVRILRYLLSSHINNKLYFMKVIPVLLQKFTEGQIRQIC